MSKQTEALKLALKKAFDLGQRYWQQADSDFTSQWRKADVTLASFNQLVEDTIREALAEQPAQQQKEGFASPGGGYVPAIPRPMPLDWKLVPRKATPEMLKAMDECAQEGYDERLYAGMASSVYMAAWDASPVMGTLPEQPAQQQEPVALDPKDVHVEVVTKQMGGFAPVMTNGIRLTHKPTGIVVEETAERSAHRNRDVAWKKLAKLVASSQPAQQQSCYCPNCEALSKELAAIKTQQQEPVAIDRLYIEALIEGLYQNEDPVSIDAAEEFERLLKTPASPPASKPWVELTELEALGAYEAEQQGRWGDHVRGLLAVEAKLREKNT